MPETKAKTQPTTLAGKLAAIYSKIEAFEKGGRNQQQGYVFISIEQVVQHIRPLLAEQGVVMFPAAIEDTWEERETRSGGVMTVCKLRVTWTVSDGEQDLVVTSIGEAHDSGDKAGNKAQTAAWKQALTKLFFVAADEDNDANTPEERAPRQRGNNPPTTPPAQRRQGNGSASGGPQAPPPQQQGGRRPPPTTDQGYGVCPQHGYAWFQKGKMRGPAHPNEDGTWCDKPETDETAGQRADPGWTDEPATDAASLPW